MKHPRVHARQSLYPPAISRVGYPTAMGAVMKRTVLLSFFLAIAISGCGQSGAPKFESVQRGPAPLPLVDAKLKVAQRDPAQSIASAPDRGALFDARSRLPVAGGKAVRIELSESHALASIASGILRLPMADGSTRTYRYLRRMEYPDGTWTWVGRGEGDNPGLDAVLTFGASAVFGSFPQADGSTLQLETVRDRTFAYVRPASAGPVASEALDSLVPAQSRGLLAPGRATAAASVSAALPDRYGEAGTIDVQVFYFKYLREEVALSKESTHVLIRYFGDVANVALRNSKVNAQVRILGFQELEPIDPYLINFSTIGSNRFLLEQMTGERRDGSPVVRPGWVLAMEQARNDSGADLAVLFRYYPEGRNITKTPEECGASWSVGANGQAVGPDEAKYGYLIVAKSVLIQDSFGDVAVQEDCPDTTLAHHLGHVLGGVHDAANAGGVEGRYPYSHGYKENTGDPRTSFSTLLGDSLRGASGNTLFRVYSSPELEVCQRRSCGVANQADLVRTFRQMVPIVAAFREQVVPLQPDEPVRLIAVDKVHPSGFSMNHALSQADNYQSYTQGIMGVQLGGDGRWVLGAADWDLDGTPEMLRVHRMAIGSSGEGKTTIHLGALSLATNPDDFRRPGVNYSTLLHATGRDRSWNFKFGDYNLDGRTDLYAIKKQGASGRTEVHVLNGRAHFQQYFNQSATALAATGTNNQWSFDLGDYNQDGMLDLYAFKRSTVAGDSEVHIMDGTTRFATFLLHKKLPLPALTTDKRWELLLAEADGDDFPDLHVIDSMAPSGFMELTVLRGAGDFQAVLSSTQTALPATSNPEQWDFMLFSMRFPGLNGGTPGG